MIYNIVKFRQVERKFRGSIYLDIIKWDVAKKRTPSRTPTNILHKSVRDEIQMRRNVCQIFVGDFVNLSKYYGRQK